MGIDQKFRTHREVTGVHRGHAVWLEKDSDQLGIHGTQVAVDFEACTADGSCLNVCPVAVFEWVEIADRAQKEKKSDPANEAQCVFCMACEKVCPTRAIVINPE